MSIIRKPDIALSGLSMPGSVLLYDQLPAVPGNHLRWNFNPEMGFPPGGFTLYRGISQSNTIDDVGTGVTFNLLTNINLPVNATDALNRILHDAANPAALTSRFQQASHELVDVLNQLRDVANPLPMYLRMFNDPAHSGLQAGLRMLDSVLLGCLDPYIARMTGLYYIDRSVSASVRYAYKVTGHWGAVTFPAHTIDFTDTPVIPQEYQTLSFGAIKVIAGLRTIGVPTLDGIDLLEKHLLVQGDANPIIKLHFDFPVEEVIINHNVWDRSGLVTAPVWGLRADGVDITVPVSANRIHIKRPGNAFERLEVFQGPAGTWRIFSISYRKKIAAVGDLTSPVFITPVATPGVVTPVFTNVAAEEMPLILDNSGYVSPPVSQISLSAWAPQPVMDTFDVPASTTTIPSLITNAPGFPVRLMFGRSVSATTTPTEINIQDGVYAPSLYRERTRELAVPDLMGFWSFNGHFKNVKNGVSAVTVGNLRLVKDPTDSAKTVLKLSGDDAVRVTGQPELKDLGSIFTLEATIRIDTTNAEKSTIIGNNAATGFWLGLIRQSDGNYKVQLSINGNVFNAVTALPVQEWIKVTVSYNGSKVRFHISHRTFSVSENDQTAAIGRVGMPAGDIAIGGDLSTTSLRWGFAGYICNVCIWQREIHPLESNKLIKQWEHFLPQQQATAEMIHYDTKTYLISTSRDPVVFEKTLQLKALSTSFSMYLWTFPLTTNGTVTLLGNKWSTGFWLGLLKVGTLYRIRIWLNGSMFESTALIPADQWSHVGFSYNGASLQFFINGVVDRTVTAALGALNNNDLRIGIGSDTGAADVAGQYRYNGYIHGIQIWRKAIAISQWQQKMAAVQQVDKFLPNARHYYFAKGVDLFGRASSWSPSRNILTKALPEYNVPLNVHTAFKPVTGTITLVTTYDQHYELTTNCAYDEKIAAFIAGYDAIVSREILYSINGADKPTLQNVEQLFDIESTHNEKGWLKLRINKVPFTQLIPQPGDRMVIQLDYDFRLHWVWTGMQQLYYPSATRFKAYHITGHMNEIVAPVSNIMHVTDQRLTMTVHAEMGISANELVGRRCLVGPHSFTIKSHGAGVDPVFDLHYAGMPAITPAEGDLMKITLTEDLSLYFNYEEKMYWSAWPESIAIGGPNVYTTGISQTVTVWDLPAVTNEQLREELPASADIRQRQQLIANGVDWMPLSRVYKISFPKFSAAGSNAVSAKDYIPGALVFFDSQAGRMRWRAFYVLWHECKGEVLDAYVLPGEKAEDIPNVLVSNIYTARLYAGKQYQLDGQVPDLELLSAEPTLQYHLALVTADDTGRESPLSRKATMVAVNRKRPGGVPVPLALINEKADYYNTCKVTVQWPVVGGQGILYKLYRATDSAMYTRDLEQRRTRQNYYRELSDADIFSDDPDFTEWLRTIDDTLTISDLFAPKDSTAWQTVTPVWRKWADRFYPALDNLQLRTIALRAGNEKAFSLVTGKPLATHQYTDSVNGVVSNRYYYRLRLVNNAGAESMSWGSISEPVVPFKVMAPAKPVFSKIEAGDRQITLHWSLNRERDLKEYRLYRSETIVGLDDLRWWRIEADPRIIARIPDPRIKTLHRSILLPGTLRITGISGVYRADEFDRQASVDSLQPHACNYFHVESADPGELPGVFIPADNETAFHTIQDLRRIEDGTEVVVVYRDDNEEEHTLFYLHNQFPYTDQGLEGLKDYYYRLVAVNEAGRVSVGADVIKARPTDIQIPIPPQWISGQWIKLSSSGEILSLSDTTGHPAIQLQWEVLAVPAEGLKIERKAVSGAWVGVSPWLSYNTTAYIDSRAVPDKQQTYRIIVKSYGKNINRLFHEIDVDKL